jgi:hypothetical protein
MNSFIVTLTYILATVLGYVILSSCAMLIVDMSFLDITRTSGWTMIYMLFIHWAIAIPTSMEVNRKLGDTEWC